MGEVVYIGELNRSVELFQFTNTQNAGGETVEAEQSLGKKFAARKDVSAKEDEDGRLLPVNTVKFIIRWIEDIMVNGSKYFIRDYDGDYLISGVIEVAGPMRRRFIEIQATRRG